MRCDAKFSTLLEAMMSGHCMSKI